MTVEVSLIFQILCAVTGAMLALYDIFTGNWPDD